jgi:MYXO-CTERM domain-containing protein
LLIAASPAAALAQPADVAIEAGDRQLTVSWDAAGAEYNLYIAAEPGVGAATVSALAGGRAVEGVAPPVTVRGLDNNRTYYLVVGEVDDGGAIAESAEIVAIPRGTWAATLPGIAVSAIAADAEVPGLFLAGGNGAGDGCAGAPKVEGCDIYRSDDGGQSWESSTAGVEEIDIRALASRAGIAVAASLAVGGGGEKLLRSGNGGRSWELALTGVAQAENDKAAAVDPGDGMTFFAGNFNIGQPVGQSRLLVTRNGGTSWETVTEIGAGALDADAVAVSPSDSQVVWLGGDGTPALAQSLDGGASFAAVDPGVAGAVEAIAFNGEMSGQMWIAIDEAVLASSNGGATFTAAQAGLEGAVRDLAHGDGLLFVATSAGVFHSADGGQSFARLGEGLTADTRALAYGLEGELAAATAAGVFRLDLTVPPPLAPRPDAGVDPAPESDGGCGCHGAGGEGAPLGLLLVVIAVGFRARRRQSKVVSSAVRIS